MLLVFAVGLLAVPIEHCVRLLEVEERAGRNADDETVLEVVGHGDSLLHAPLVVPMPAERLEPCFDGPDRMCMWVGVRSDVP